MELQASIHHVRIIKEPPILHDFRKGFIDAVGRTVRALGHHCLNDVRNGHDSRPREDFATRKTLRISRTIHPLVVLKHSPGNLQRELYRPADVVAGFGMGPDDAEFDIR
jgi:hypothetical protein